MAYIKRIAFRHLHALKVQTIGALGMIAKACLKFDIREWLAVQAPILLEHLPEKCDALYEHHDDKLKNLTQNYSMLLNVSLLQYESSIKDDSDLRDYFLQSLRSSSASDHAAEDYFGSNLGGAWDIDGFVVRSSIILTLSVSEEFERGVIRILASHGSTTLPLARSQAFVPRLKDYNEASPIWEKLRRSTQTVQGRHKILRQYGIDPSPDVSWMFRLIEIRKRRNEIAHGIGAPEVTLDTFLNVHYDVWRSVAHLSREVEAVQRIIL
ncbi:MAG: hypothetical protein A2X56_00060 [Nitrospirae bacterium GWC2_57_13]|nr:MAG: hypothetical protein A2X56_00060 [Nitrospirae bacterium GWC2_57_13]